MARISGSKAASCPRRNWSSAAMCGASIANTPPNGCGVPVGEMTALGVLVIDGRILARNHEITTQLSLLAGLPSLLRNLVDLDERSEEHTSELQSLRHLVFRLLL